MKQLLFLSLILATTIIANAQREVLTKYYDSAWEPASRENAVFFTEFQKVDTFYRFTSYWMSNKKVRTRSASPDTLFSKMIDHALIYYQNGQLEDSVYYYTNGEVKNNWHFYDNGKLWATYKYNQGTKTSISKGYEVNGELIDDFVYMQEASFKDGEQDWLEFLSKNIKANTPAKKGAPVGKYTVIIRFVIDPKGKVIKAYGETNLGYGMEEEAIRVINKSPKWSPALFLNKGLDAYRRQPVTFVVEN